MGTWVRLLSYLRPYRGRLGLAVLAMVALAATTGLYPLLLDLLTTLLFQGKSGAEALLAPKMARLSGIAAWVGLTLSPEAIATFVESNVFPLFGAVVLVKATSQAVRFYAMGDVAQKLIRDLRDQLFAAIVRQSSAFFGKESTGHLISRVMNDVAQVERAATYAVPILFGDGLRVLVLATVCLVQYTELTLVSAIVVPVAIWPVVRFGRLLKRYARRGQESLGTLTHRVAETVGGIRVVHTYGAEEREIEHFRRENQGYVDVMMKSVLARAVQTPIMELVGIGALILTSFWAQHRIEQGLVRPGEVVAFLLALVLLYEPMKAIGRLNGIILPGLAAAERVFELIDKKVEVIDRPGAQALPKKPSRVVLDEVRFRYPGAEREAVAGVSLVLERGKVVGLCGASGSGKSTIAALIPRLWDVSGGSILVDGLDIRDVTQASLRSEIAIVSQETYLFHDTIRANIAYGRPQATDAEIEQAARAAFAHDFISALPAGYQTKAGERGVELSGGQRQRIAIARAFLRDAPILILDEATSALDNESEREVQRALEALMEHRASLVIAHRLSTLRGAHQILVLEEGRVVERGSPAELAEREGPYLRLLRAGEGEARA
ncbi:MAG: ABC transporter ATP-binding protein [Myxococcota bacterium]